MSDALTELLDTKEETEIKDLIYEFRGKQVMLDSDLANLFEVETKALNQQMKRNINRFPEDFCFRLNREEYFSILRSQNVTSNALSSKRRYYPYVYTEQGIIALAGVLKSDIADQMCIRISRVFAKMKHMIATFSFPLEFLSKFYGEFIDFKEFTLNKFDEIFKRLEKLEPKKEVLLLDDEWFNAFDAVVKLVEHAKESIVLVDPYADEKSLVYLSHKRDGVKVTIYKGQFSKLKIEEVEAFSKQYGEIVVKDYFKSHNRFLILDSDEVYDLGTSLNKIGNKIFTINKIEIEEIINVLIEKFSL